MVVAEVMSVAPHPKADRLRVCQVDAGGAATVKVVTNAANVEEGMKVVFAVRGGLEGGAGRCRGVGQGRPGVLICSVQFYRVQEDGGSFVAGPVGQVHLNLPTACAPSSPQPVDCTTRSGIQVEQASLRGVESFGMLCSAHECGWVSEPGTWVLARCWPCAAGLHAYMPLLLLCLPPAAGLWPWRQQPLG